MPVDPITKVPAPTRITKEDDNSSPVSYVVPDPQRTPLTHSALVMADAYGKLVPIGVPTRALNLGAIGTWPGVHPLAPWESPGGAKFSFDPRADKSLSIVTGWETFSQTESADGAGAIAATDLVATRGATGRIQVGHLSINTGGTAGNGLAIVQASGTDQVAVGHCNGGNYQNWCGYLLPADESLQITGTNLGNGIAVTVTGQYRIVQV